MQPAPPHEGLEIVKVEEHVNQAVLVLNKESVAPIETARGVLNFGLSAIHIKVHKGDSNAASSFASNPAEQVLAEELEAPGGPEDGYSTDSSLSKEMRALGPVIEDVDLSDTEEARVTVVEVAAVDVTNTSTLREKTVLSVLDFSIFDLKSEPRTTHTKNTKIVIEVFSV